LPYVLQVEIYATIHLVKKWILLIVFGVLAFVAARPIFAQQTILTAPGSDGVMRFAPVEIEEQKTVEDAVEAAKNGQPSIHSSGFELFQTVLAGTNIYANGSQGAGIEGASAGMGRAIALMYQERPAETGTFVADLIHSANIAPPAYAQGLGFAALNPVLSTWKVFRNLAYLFYVVIFLVIGFMIMFRQKLGSQAVVTAQQALPGIVVSLLAVTFSYAIAGLLIDGMYLFMFLLTAVFTPQLSNLKQLTLDRNIFDIGFQLLTSGGLGTVHEAVNKMISSIVGAGPDGQTVTGWIGGLLFAIVFGFALLISVFKVFFELLKSYIAIVIAVVLSPLILAFALPGKSPFQGWLRGLIGNLIVFPTVLMCLILSFMLKESIGGESGGGFLPPYLIQGATPQVISTIFGMGILLVLPEIITKVRDSVGGPDPFAWFSQALGKRLGEGRNMATWAPTRAASLAGIGPETGFEKTLLGSRSYRQRQQELAILSKNLKPEERPNLTTYGGVAGSWEKRFGLRDAQKRNVETAQSREQRDAATLAGTSRDAGQNTPTKNTPDYNSEI
jgi:hypothetical protein